MKCPIDGNELVAVERSGIEIDYCPTCRGVWLDRGELDKLIQREGERSAAVEREYDDYYEKRKRAEYDDDRYERRDYPPQQGYDPRYGGKPHRRKSVFEEVFDIFD